MAIEYETSEALNMNLDLKPLVMEIPGHYKVRRLTQNYGDQEMTMTRESTFLDIYFAKAKLNKQTRDYVITLLNASIEDQPEATVEELVKDHKDLTEKFSDRPEFEEAINILFGRNVTVGSS